MLGSAIALAPACMEMEGEPEEDPGLEEIEGVSEGAMLFNQATFGGNGRTCKTCHPSDNGQSGTFNPAEATARFNANPNDALFTGDGADTIGGNTFNRIKQHATVLITLPLADTVSIQGSSARTVTVARGTPTTMNVPALDPVLMYDGREPDLQSQARNAIIDHAGTSNVTTQQLNDIAAFQRTLFNRNNLKKFFQDGTPVTLPQGKTMAEKRGRRWFIDDNKTSANDVGESKFNVCGFCHSGPRLDAMSNFFVTNVAPPGFFAEGDRFFTVLVSEFNRIGNPTNVFVFDNGDGTTTEVESPDLGIFALAGFAPPLGNGFFKIPTVWGSKHTAPYFHDNSAKNFVELMDHYDDAIFILSETDNPETTLGQVDLSEQDKADIIAYMNLL
ncbi:MAG TPA: hypothetical protein VFU21_15400 [Kofleriaceae bacterium]|nr:hypothetical protein [Kofleriaceae bacterium]